MEQSEKRKPFVVGLTGSIGSGKSTVLSFFERENIPVFSADSCVHQLFEKNRQVRQQLREISPLSFRKNKLDRHLLGEDIAAHPLKLKKLESILHPLVEKAEKAFIRAKGREGKKIVLLEIPLLFETLSEKRCDLTVLVEAPKKIRETRVLSRPGMTRAKFKFLSAQQMSDKEKRKRADILLKTNVSLKETRQQTRLLIRMLKKELPFA